MMLQINGDRLWSRLMEIGEVGATAKGGCNRQALTDSDVAGRELFTRWCENAGCEVRTDEIGNIFARRAGKDSSAPVVLTGSHLDTQPTGGKFDGIYGVLAGLEVIETLNDHEIETIHPIEVVVWCNEEGCRFTTAMMGSAVWSGTMPLHEAMELRDTTGVTVADELQRTNQAGPHAAEPFPVKAAFEAHIEQGPVLEHEEKTIGIVTGVQNMSRHEIVIEGQEAHAGPTPMAIRRDPMRALSSFLPKLYAMCENSGPDGRVTFGVINAEPASNNTVPGKLSMTIDIRHPDRKVYEAMVDQMQTIVRSYCEEESTPVTIREFFSAPGVEFSENCVASVTKATEGFGYSNRKMVSGAGHDSCNVAAVAPTAMIFIPCADGISHNEAESAEPEHVTAGANVLLNAMLDQAS
jgi:N-carbamoyl-L-amino-acid hydrolase